MRLKEQLLEAIGPETVPGPHASERTLRRAELENRYRSLATQYADLEDRPEEPYMPAQKANLRMLMDGCLATLRAMK